MLKIQGKPESIGKTFRLPLDLVEKLDKIAYENNLSLNQLVIQCLNFAFDNIDTGEEKLDNYETKKPLDRNENLNGQ